jgi:gold/copper resistance efflux pump
MSFVRFFIHRPIFAGVLSILIVIGGLLALTQLPLAEYPQVAPPTVVVRAMYPGANPETIAETVAAPLEQEINGVEGMQYMTSHSSGDGRVAVTITFAQGVDPQTAQIEVQNRVARAVPRLPADVQRLGVVTEKTAPDMLMVVHVHSPKKSYDILELYNFSLLQIKDELARLEGVGNVIVWGAGEYSLRVWLDPDRIAAHGLTASDVVQAIREQNVQVAAGTIGQPPEGGADFQVALRANGRLSSPEEFEEIVLRAEDDTAITRLKDVARIEIGANRYGLRSLLDNEPAAGIQIIQSPDASALATAARVRAAMERLQKQFPTDIEYRIAYDPTIFVQASIDNVIKTLFEAVLLVVVVVILFLKTWRASLIPLAAVPVSLIGTFAVMHAFGFSLNTLSLFGLVLSIGIVVDDAIVVVENVERHLRKGLAPREAAFAAMREVTGPIIAITSVLVAVFIPTAFLSGLTGQFYGQFALTIAISTVLSALNSLTLSPALAAVLLKPHANQARGVAGKLLAAFFAKFESFFEKLSGRYVNGVSRVLRAGSIVAVLYVGLLALTGVGFQVTPAGFVPAQDKHYLVGIVQLPSGASLERTEAVAREMTSMALSQEGVESIATFPGLSINGFVTNPSSAVMFIMLDPFEQRRADNLSANAIAQRLNALASTLPEAFIGIFPPPPVPGLGNVGGFKLQIQDRNGQGYEALAAATAKLVGAASSDKRVAGLFSGFQVNVPQIDVDIDRTQAKLLNVPLDNLYDTLQIYLGSMYVNDFTMSGRNYQVFAQADAAFRQDASDIARLHTRNAAGEIVPVGSLLKIGSGAGPDPVVRYNGYAAADITGAPAPGVSSGEAIAAMEQLAREHLPPGFGLEWTELTYQQIKAGNTAMVVFPLAVVLALLILAALYNSWSLPFAVLMLVPIVLLSSLVGVWLTGGDNNIFTQIGFIVLVGLAAKNAILIVEFARQREQQGASHMRAVLDAANLRLRPILMTSLAFIMGVVPLVLASGAGSEMRHAMGIAVFAGMIGVTLFGLFLTPLFYVLLRRLAARTAASATASISLEVSHA